MSINDDFLNAKLHHPPERLTLFSICCPCLRPKKLRCRASDIALVMYGKDEPHEYVLEKLVIKRIPLRVFGVEEDFLEYEKSLKESSKITCEREIAVTNFEQEKELTKVEEHEEENISEHKAESERPETKSAQVLTEATSGNSLRVNCNTPIDQFLDTKLSFACEPLTEPKSGEELIIRTITANEEDEMITEVDQRVAKMSPDLEKTINTLKAVKPRPVSTQGTPMPIKNQKKRLSARNVEQDGLITKEAYNYAPCANDNPLQGIHYTLNKTTFTAVEETSKSIITEQQTDNNDAQLPKLNESLMVEQGTTNYEDATILAQPEENSTMCATMINLPSLRTMSDKPQYLPSEYSSDSTNCLGTFGPRRLKNYLHTHRRKNDIGDTDFSVYHAEMLPRVARRFSPPKYSKKRNLKWKIVINNHSKDKTVPTTSSSDFQLNSRIQEGSSKRKNYWRSGVSY